MAYSGKYYGLNRDELKMLEMKKLKEGKNYQEVKKEVKRSNGFVIRNGIQKALAEEKYKEEHKEETFKSEFEKLRSGGK